MGRWGRCVLGTCLTGLQENLDPRKTKLELQLGSHTHNRVPPANVLITWNFDDPNDSPADDMVQAYRYEPNQSSAGDRSGGGGQGRQRNLCGIFLRVGMDASPSPLRLLHIHADAASQRFP